MHPSFMFSPEFEAPTSQPAHPKAFQGWVEHAARDRVGTDVVLHHLLREAHPDHHITRCLPSHCDLMGFADAGFATKTPDLSRGFDAIRKYVAPKLRHEKGQDKLEDEVRFGAWRYEYQGTPFLVYELSHRDYFMVRVIRFQYILAPPSIAAQATPQGNHPASDALLLAASKWTNEMHDEIWVYDNQAWNKDKELFRSVQGASWDDVILPAKIKTSLVHDVTSFFDNQALYATLNVPWKRGVILHGVPGNGKTISIKALINSLAARTPPIPSLYVKSLDGCSGPKVAMQAIFAKARILAPCLLIFEDLDSLVEDKTRSYFLNEVDGLDSNNGILMIGSTNHLGQLDAAITKRPSRFDRKYHFKVPDRDARVAYGRYWREKMGYSSSSSCSTTTAATEGLRGWDFPEQICDVVAAVTEGFSFAYMKELFVTSLMTLARRSTTTGGNGMDVDEDEDDEEGSEAGSGVVVDPPEGETKTKEETDGDDGKEKEKENDKKKPKPKRVMPEVEIPESLKDNVLLVVILAEAKMLWEQMDNEEEDAIKRKKAASCGVVDRFWGAGPVEDD